MQQGFMTPAQAESMELAEVRKKIAKGSRDAINVNDVEYQHYVAAREAKKVKNESLDTMKNDLDGLKSEMNEIKSLLKELVNGN